MPDLKGKIRFFAAGFMMLLIASLLQSGMVKGEDSVRTVDGDHVKVYVAGILVTDANKDNVLGDENESVKYDPTGRVLSLNNADIPVTAYEYDSKSNRYGAHNGIFFTTDTPGNDYEANRVTIDLTGENRIETKTLVRQANDSRVYGVFAFFCPLTLKGEGSLTVDLGYTEGFDRYIHGINACYGKLKILEGVSLQVKIDAPFDPRPSELYNVNGIILGEMELTGGKIQVDIQSRGADCSGIAALHDIRITDQAEVEVNISSPQYQEGDSPASVFSGIGQESAQALFVEDSTVTVQVGGTVPAAGRIYGIKAPVSVKGNSRLKVSAGNADKAEYNSLSVGIFVSSNIDSDHPLKSKLIEVGGNAVAEISGYDRCVLRSTSMYVTDTYPDFSDYALGEYGNARVSDDISGTPFSVWEGYKIKNSVSSGKELSSYKYARFPAYLPEELLKGTFEARGEDGILKKKAFYFLEGTSAKDLADKVKECIDDEYYTIEINNNGSMKGRNKTSGMIDLLLGFDEDYSDMQAFTDSFNGRTFTKDVKVYLFRLSPITRVSVDITPPVEGKRPNGYAGGITAASFIGTGDTAETAEGLEIQGVWKDAETGKKVKEAFEAGKKYPLFITIKPGFGYFIPYSEYQYSGQLDVNGADCRYSYANESDGIGLQLDVMCIPDERAKVQEFMSLADALPDADNIRLSDAETVNGLRAKYESLTEEEKGLVKKESLQRLLDAEEAIVKLKAEIPVQKEQKPSGPEKEQKQEKAGKSANPITVSGKKVSVKAAKLQKSAVSFAGKKIMKITDAKGKVSYSLKGVKKAKFKKYFSINKKTGKLKIKKKLKKGTYTLNILVCAQGDDAHEKGEASAKVIIKVK